MYSATTNSNYFALRTQNDNDDVTVVRRNCGQNKIENDAQAKNIFPLPPSHFFTSKRIRRIYTVMPTQGKAWQETITNHNFREPPNSETMFNASNIKIAVDMAVAGQFFIYKGSVHCKLEIG